MSKIFWFAVVGIILTNCPPAGAESRYGSYQIVPYSNCRSCGKTEKIVILDGRTGMLWSWSEKEGTAFLARIGETVGSAPFARIIHVGR